MLKISPFFLQNPQWSLAQFLLTLADVAGRGILAGLKDLKRLGLGGGGGKL